MNSPKPDYLQRPPTSKHHHIAKLGLQHMNLGGYKNSVHKVPNTSMIIVILHFNFMLTGLVIRITFSHGIITSYYRQGH